MNVSLDFVGDVVIDDTGDRFHIEASCSDICCHQGCDFAIPEAFENFEAAFLIMIAMKRARGVASSPQIAIQFDHCSTSVAEYDAGFAGVRIQQLMDPILFRPILAANKLLIDFWDGGHLLDR